METMIMNPKKINLDVVQEVIAKTCLKAGLTVTELKENKTEFTHIIKKCIICFLKDYGIKEDIIGNCLGYEKGSRFMYYLNFKNIENNSNFIFWYDEAKMIFRNILNEKNEVDNIYDFDKWQKIVYEQSLFS